MYSKICLVYVDSIKTSSSLTLNEDMNELEVLIKFSPYANRSNEIKYSSDNIKLFIIYGTYCTVTRGKSRVQILLNYLILHWQSILIQMCFIPLYSRYCDTITEIITLQESQLILRLV